MKTDRELLELAAKAAGYARLKYFDDAPYVSSLLGGEDFEAWNPLTDDGDALRLAVKLRIDLRNFTGASNCISASSKFIDEDSDEEYDPNPYASTRRAIVRASAAIGEANEKVEVPAP